MPTFSPFYCSFTFLTNGYLSWPIVQHESSNQNVGGNVDIMLGQRSFNVFQSSHATSVIIRLTSRTPIWLVKYVSQTAQRVSVEGYSLAEFQFSWGVQSRWVSVQLRGTVSLSFSSVEGHSLAEFQLSWGVQSRRWVSVQLRGTVLSSS